MALSLGLTTAGHPPTSLDTNAVVTLAKVGESFAITRIDLTLKGVVPGLSEAEFKRLAEDAKKNCIISRAISNVPMTLEATLTSPIERPKVQMVLSSAPEVCMVPRVDLADRRLVLRSLAMSAAFFSVPGAFAQQLVPTAAQTEGPFYPDQLPLDTDNDLLDHQRRHHARRRRVTHLAGGSSTPTGNPVRNALVEIWQVDNKGAYIHTGSTPREARRELPGLRPVPDRVDRRVPVPHDQARRLSRPHAAHPLRGEDEGPREVHHPVLHQGRAAQREGRGPPRH